MSIDTAPSGHGRSAPALLWSRGETLPAPLMEEMRETGSAGLRRLWRGFMVGRCFVALVLLLLQVVSLVLGVPVPTLALLVGAGYLAVAALGVRLVGRGPLLRRFGTTWLATAGIDVGVFALLQSMQGTALNLNLLYALPVLTCAVLGTRTVSLGTAALATLLLLVQAAWQWAQPAAADNTPQFVQAALTGSGLFVLALLAHQLALRLAREEAQASRSQAAARMHAEVSDLVIETLSEGVLVIDAGLRVHAANPAADEVLGHGLADLPLPFQLTSHPAWQPLAQLASKTFSRRAPQMAELPVAQSSGAAREVRVRTRLTPAGVSTDSMCVMFLQDLRELEARIRTEKLAAMGRMSAAVAHEIRNPLSAITQASALLAEDLQDPAHQRLTRMVEHNAQRLARIVDDVLDVARVRQQRVLPLDERLLLDATVRTLAEEWVRQSRHQGLLVVLGAPETAVRFDAEHLRRILVNLLDNAARYAGTREGAIQVQTLLPGDGRPRLSVWSDGAALEPAVRQHLFEPFFSSESRSSGLGLFICRELCERHGGAIGYARRALSAAGPEGNEFWVSFLPSGTAGSAQ